jgi:hypothetical protein
VAIDNRTPFEVSALPMLGPEGGEVLLLLLQATFDFHDAVPVVAEEQRPIPFADEYRGDPTASSLRVAGSVCPRKARVDVLVEGHAQPLEPSRRVLLHVRVGDVVKEAVARGEADGLHRAVFQRMPVVYERAAGSPGNLANPVGVAFRHANIVACSGARTPVGFGPLAPWWQPRAYHVGTYDDAWRRERFPLPPRDASPDFHQVAPPDQQCATSPEGRTFELLGFSPHPWRGHIPTLDVPVHLEFDTEQHVTRAEVDTVLMLPDEHRVCLTARLVLPVKRRRPLLAITLGHLTRGYLRARARRKHYVDGRHPDGTDPQPPLFHA